MSLGKKNTSLLMDSFFFFWGVETLAKVIIFNSLYVFLHLLLFGNRKTSLNTVCMYVHVLYMYIKFICKLIEICPLFDDVYAKVIIIY